MNGRITLEIGKTISSFILYHYFCLAGFPSEKEKTETLNIASVSARNIAEYFLINRYAFISRSEFIELLLISNS